MLFSVSMECKDELDITGLCQKVAAMTLTRPEVILIHVAGTVNL